MSHSDEFKRLHLSHPSGGAAQVFPYGAHVASWIPAGGAEALFMSRAARFQPGTAIRGGVPVIFPQFAQNGPLPKHGFARTETWERVDDDAPHRATLRLRDTAGTRELWPHAFLAELQVEVGGGRLSIALTVRNTDEEAFEFTAALHTYLRVADARRASITGLQGLRYRDKARGNDTYREEDPELHVPREIDRVYLDAPAELRVHDAAGGRTILVGSGGFADAVVWNPGPEGAAGFPDMAAGEEREMLCVEAAQVANPIRLDAGERWRGVQTLTIA